MKTISKIGACAVLAAGVATSAFGQLQVAGTLQVNLDMVSLPVGPTNLVVNTGAAGNVFQAITNAPGGSALMQIGPQIIAVGGNGTHGMLFDWNGCLAHEDGSGNPVFAPSTITGTPTNSAGTFQGFSTEAWVYEATIPDDNPVVSWGTRGNCSPNQVSCAYGANSSYGGLAMWCNDHGWGVGGSPVAGQWHHLVWTLDASGNENLYSDGVLKASYTGVTPAPDPNNNILIGGSHATTGGSMSGALFGGCIVGRVRIEDGILTATQVATNYLLEVGTFTNGTPAFLSAKPLHRWSFTNAAAADATGMTVQDIGTANGTTKQVNAIIRNNGGTTTFTGSQLTLSGGNSATAPYVDFTNSLVSVLSTNNGGTGQATFEAWVTESATGSWTPLFDIGSTSIGQVTGPGGSFSGVNYIGFVANANGGSANQSAVGTANGNYTFASQFSGHAMHVAMTWDDVTNNVITVYENGVEVGQTIITNRMAGIQDVNNWLGRSAWSGDANFNGSVSEFRIFNRVVTPAEILNDYQVGPSVVGSVLKWNGNVSGNWDINGTANWLVGAAPVKYSDGTTVQFDDTLTGTTNINLTTGVQPLALTVNNTSSNYIFGGTGSINGTVGLTKTGNGTLTINNVNGYTGVTALQGGTVIVTNLANGGVASPIGAASSGAANLSFAGGTLSYRGAPVTVNRGYAVSASSTLDVQGNLTITGPITASGGTFTKNGAATLTLSGAGYNKLSAGGGGQAFGVANGTVVIDGTASQTNTVTGETWVGFNQVNNANLIMTNTVMTNSSWFAIGRGNGTGGLSSSVSLYNTYYTCGNVSLGYNNGITGNRQTVSLALSGSSKLNNIGGTGFNLSESAGSSSTLTISDNSSVNSVNRILIGLSANSTGAVVVANSGAITNGGWVSIGAPGVATATLKDNAVWQALTDFNVTDTAGSSSAPSIGTLNISNNATLILSTLYLGKNTYCTGTINQSGGSVIRSGGGDWRIGGNVSGAANQFGTWNLSGGTVTCAANFQIGAYGNGTFNQSGGTVNLTGGYPDVGRFAGGVGILNISGGSFNQLNNGNILLVGEAGTGTINVSGTGTITCQGSGTGLGIGWAAGGSGTLNLTNGNVIVTNALVIGNNASAAGTVSLYGGTLSAGQVKTTAGTSTLNFSGGTLKAMPNANANFLSGLSSVTVFSSGAFIDTGTNAITIAQDLFDGGSGSLTKLGVGALTLSGNQYYSGPLTVTAGKLTIPTAGLALGTSGLSVADGAEFDAQVTQASGELSPASLTLGTTTGSTLDLDLGTFGNAGAAPLFVPGTFTANGTTTVNILGSGLNLGQFALVKYGTRAGAGNFVLGNLPPGVVASIVTNVPNSSIDLNVTAINILLWTGLNGGNWDIGTTFDWTNILSASAATYLQGSSVIFDDSAPGTNAANLTTTISPSSIVFSNNAVSYSLVGNGKLSGGGSLSMYGTGAVTLGTTNNNYSGTTLVGGGSLTAGAPSSLSSNSAVVVDNATLNILGNSQTVKTLTTSNAIITGTSGTLTGTNYVLENSSVAVPLAGSATLTTTAYTNTEAVSVANNNTYTGRTVVGGGVLYATNLANGGTPSSIGASPSSPANLVFGGGTLSYGGPSTSIDRGYTVTANSTLDTENSLLIKGQVLATGGTFTKAGPATMTVSNNAMNQLSAGGGGRAVGVANGTLVLDGSSGQTNRVTGEVWVGFDTAHSATLILTNTVLTNSSWFAVGRGNGVGGFTSTVVLNNSTVSAGNVSFGYDNGIAGNSQTVAVTLNNNSRFINTGGSFNFTESPGSSTALTINDTSWLTSSSRILIGMGLNSTGMVTVAGSGAITNGGWVSIGDPGTGIVTLKNNAVWQALTDFNVTDIAADPSAPSYGELDVQDNALLRIFTLYLGKGSTGSANSYCTGVINQSGGTVIGAGGGDWRIGGNNTTTFDSTVFGTYNLSGGYVQSTANLQIGSGGTGEWNQTGGTTVVPGYPSIGRFANSVGQLDVSGGVFSQTNVNDFLEVGEAGTGTLNVTNTGHVIAAGGVLIGTDAGSLGTVNLGTGGTLSATHVYTPVSAGSSTFNFNGGTLQALPGSYLNFMGGATPLGVVFVYPGGANIDSGANNITISQTLNDAGGGLTKFGSGTLNLAGANNYSGMTTVSNGTLLVDGLVSGGVTVAAGTLGGSGEINGPITVNSSGTLAPGDAGIGVLTNLNTLTLLGATVAEISRSSGFLTNDQVTGLSQVNYGGSLTVNNVGSDQLQVGDTFQLFSAGTYAGSFASVSLPSPYIWTNHLALNGTIQVIGLGVATNPTNIVAKVVSGSLQLSWPADHTGWVLQSQTNTLAQGLNPATWVAVPGSTTTNMVTVPINAANGSVFYRLMH